MVWKLGGAQMMKRLRGKYFTINVLTNKILLGSKALIKMTKHKVPFILFWKNLCIEKKKEFCHESSSNFTVMQIGGMNRISAFILLQNVTFLK